MKSKERIDAKGLRGGCRLYNGSEEAVDEEMKRGSTRKALVRLSLVRSSEEAVDEETKRGSC
jgi:hypothetical protein